MRRFASYRRSKTQHPEDRDPRSPTVTVGAPATGAEYQHAQALLSLDNLKSAADLDRWLNSNLKRLDKLDVDAGELAWYVEPKVDGLAVNIAYIEGSMVAVATRGDGTTGDRIDHLQPWIAGIPAKLLCHLADHIEVRGELFMSKEHFAVLNQRREAMGKDLFANPRNTVAGAVSTKDLQRSREVELQFVAHGYAVIAAGDSPDERLSQVHTAAVALREAGFETLSAERVDNRIDLARAVLRVSEQRDAYVYQIDGAVIRFDARTHMEMLGSTSRAPRGVVAYKFMPEQAKTHLREITLQTGRSGVVTPVGELEPVQVGGVTISRATLHNFRHIATIEAAPGCEVVVQRAGDVIPEIVAVSGESSEDVPPWSPDGLTCACGAALVKLDDGPRWFCGDVASCEQVALQRLGHFIQRDALDIEGISEATVADLYQWGWLKSYSDFFHLARHRDEWCERPGYKDKSVDKHLAQIEAARDCSLERVLTGIGIPGVGKDLAAKLAAWFGSLTALRNAHPEEFAGIEGLKYQRCPRCRQEPLPCADCAPRIRAIIDALKKMDERDELQPLLAALRTPETTRSGVDHTFWLLWYDKTRKLLPETPSHSFARKEFAALLKFTDADGTTLPEQLFARGIEPSPAAQQQLLPAEGPLGADLVEEISREWAGTKLDIPNWQAKLAATVTWVHERIPLYQRIAEYREVAEARKQRSPSLTGRSNTTSTGKIYQGGGYRNL